LSKSFSRAAPPPAGGSGWPKAVWKELEFHGSFFRADFILRKPRATTLEFLVKQCKAQMRANGERPQGGIHEAAVAQVATSQGVSPEALKHRITRRKKRPSK
jgi:hypothetical protein